MRLLFTVFLLAIVLALPARAAEMTEIEALRCPDTYNGETLTSLDIFQGPPDAREYLVADEDGWDIQNSRAQDQKIYLSCHYGKFDAELLIEVPPNIDFCKQTDNNADCH